MNKFVLLISVAILCVIGSAKADDLLDEIVTGKFNPNYIARMHPLNDGEHYTVLSEGKYVIKCSYSSGNVVDTLFNVEKTKLQHLDKITSYQFSNDETKMLVYNNPKYRYRRSFTADYYLFDIKRNELTKLSENGAQESPLFSPDGKYVAFGRENNLYLYKVDFGTESAITKDGKTGSIINGIADWVYEEEFGRTRYFSFSPDSKMVAFVRFDESEVPTYSMQKYLDSETKQDDIPLYTEMQNFKYPKAGQKNSKVSVCVYDDFYKSVKTIKLDQTTDNFYIPRIEWTKSKDQLAIFILNRTQNRVEMRMANPRSLISKLTLVEKDKYYYDYPNLDAVKFTEDGKYFTFISERDGYRHLYLYNINGTLNRQLTKGKWDVTKSYGFDVKTKTIYYQAAVETPMQRDIYTTNAKGKQTRLTNGKGTHSAAFSNGFKYFIDSYSALNQPLNITLNSGKGELLRTLESNDSLLKKVVNLSLPNKEFFSFTTEDKTKLNGWILKPKNAENSNKKYPLLMVQYSGPNSQQVLDSWGFGWEYYLVSKGYVVASVDGRGTGARGAEFRKCTYMKLGVLESKDQIFAAEYLKKQNFIDPEKVGIWGWSYGGYMTLLSMSSGENVYKAGIAVAPVTDWRLYNTAYTERFMRTPQENVGGYDIGSPLKKAKELNGNVLIIHGTADDNVHVQNTYLYLNELMKANKQNASLWLYTDKNHSILGKDTRKNLYRNMFNFLENRLKK